MTMPVLVRRSYRGRRDATCLALVATAVVWGCRRDEPPPEKPAPAEATLTASDKPAPSAVFPARLQVADESVNAFIREATGRVFEGEYDTFRALFSARAAPLTEGQYQRAWQAVRSIEILALEQVRRESDSDWFYVALAHVRLDPANLPPDVPPERDVALLIIREHDEWKLDYAPDALREWIAGRTEAASGDHTGRNEDPNGRVDETPDAHRDGS